MSDDIDGGYDVLIAAVAADLSGADSPAKILALSAPEPATANELTRYYMVTTGAATELIRTAVEAWAGETGRAVEECLQQLALEVRRR